MERSARSGGGRVVDEECSARTGGGGGEDFSPISDRARG